MKQSSALVLIEWIDAGTVGSSEWLSKEEVIADCTDDKFINRSVGWVVHEDKLLLILSATTHTGFEESVSYDQVTRIPKSLIKRRRKVLAR